MTTDQRSNQSHQRDYNFDILLNDLGLQYSELNMHTTYALTEGLNV